MPNESYRSIHISEVPAKLIGVRDGWRYYWRWIPILGWLYEELIYHRTWNKWSKENPNIKMIRH